MRLPHWLAQAQSRNWQRLTPAQAQAIDRTWQNASRQGMAVYVLARGGALFLWSSLCLVLFGWRGHTLHIMRQPFYLACVIPCIAVFSFALPTMFYLLFRYNARRLAAWRASNGQPASASNPAAS